MVIEIINKQIFFEKKITRKFNTAVAEDKQLLNTEENNC